MVQVVGDDRVRKKIVTEKKMEFYKVVFMRRVVGVVFFLVALVVSVCLIQMVWRVLDFQAVILTSSEALPIWGIAIGIFISVNLLAVTLFRNVFKRNVSLIDRDDEEFELILGTEQYIYRKKDIEHVQVSYVMDMFNKIRRSDLSLKMKDGDFHFSLRGESDELYTMHKYFNSWFPEASCIEEQGMEMVSTESDMPKGMIVDKEKLQYMGKPFTNKSVSLIESAPDQFELIIGEEKSRYKKEEIHRVLIIYKRNKYGKAYKRVLLLKLENRVVNFTGGMEISGLDLIYNNLKNWEEEQMKVEH